MLHDVEVLRMGGKSWDDTNTNVYLDVGLDCQDGGGEVRQAGGWQIQVEGPRQRQRPERMREQIHWAEHGRGLVEAAS